MSDITTAPLKVSNLLRPPEQEQSGEAGPTFWESLKFTACVVGFLGAVGLLMWVQSGDTYAAVAVTAFVAMLGSLVLVLAGVSSESNVLVRAEAGQVLDQWVRESVGRRLLRPGAAARTVASADDGEVLVVETVDERARVVPTALRVSAGMVALLAGGS